MLSVVRYVRGLLPRPAEGEESDLHLLEAFAARRDEAAFAALVERHGPLVWGVCRRGLGHNQDAEDAFQATFMVLARKAGSVAWRDGIAGWLHAVAVRVVRKARERAVRQHALLREVAVPPPAAEPPDPDLAHAIDEEIRRLPERYRRPVVLCYLQGKTYVEAARLLGWREGTVSGRLARARDLLRRRLERRGLAPAAVAGLLAAGGTSQALPAGLVRNTVRESLAFAAGQAAPTGAAALLADGVLKTMTPERIKFSVLAVLVLATAGAGLGLAAFTSRPEPPAEPKREAPEAPQPRTPALPPAWADRWEVNPFAGATEFEIKHQRQGAPGRVYKVKDPDAVAELLKAVAVVGVQNDIGVGLVPPSIITVRRKGAPDFDVTVMGEEQLGCWQGILSLSPDFVKALNARLSKQEKADIDVTEFLPAVTPAAENRPPVKPSRNSLTAGFTRLSVTYLVGDRPHVLAITDSKTLDALHEKLKINGETPYNNEPPEQRALEIVSKDGSVLYASVVNDQEIFDPRVGRFTLAPEFIKALNKVASQAAGRDIDVAGKNAPTDEQQRRARELQKLLGGAKGVRFTSRYRNQDVEINVTEPKELKKLLAGLKVCQVPAKAGKVERRTPLAELTTADGKKVELSLVEARPATNGGIVLCDLVEVAGFGPAWIENQWKYKLNELVYLREQQVKGERDLETTRLVCADWPTFQAHVLTAVARFRDGEHGVSAPLDRDDTRAVVRLLSAGKMEKLDWSPGRWEREVGGLLDRKAATIDLAPGLGFSLPLVVRNDREMLVPGHGRLVFDRSPLVALGKLLDTEKTGKVELLPAEKK